MSIWLYTEDSGCFTTWNFETLPNVGDKITHKHLEFFVESFEWDNSNRHVYIHVEPLEL